MSRARRRPALVADRAVEGTDACVLDAVTVTYAGRTALGPVSLAVPAGQAVALVGPSGAGKTTLLRVLAGQVTPASGTVVLGGQDLSRLQSRRELPRLVGLLPQRFDLVPQLSVRHNTQAGALGCWGVLRSLAALLLPLEHPPAREAVRRVGLSELSATRVADLSGGEQQRVALARLLVQDPSVLLADEPVASLDPTRADQVLGLLRGMAGDDGRTLVASLHAPELARRHFERVVGLRDGRVVFDLPPAQVTADVLEGLYRLLSPVEHPPRQETG
jgi:phosphonate transport system ATP-binding protein